MAEVVCYDCGDSYSDDVRDCPACGLPTAISEPEKIEAEYVGEGASKTLFASFPLEWFADLPTANAVIDRARRIADEKNGGAKADH